MPIAALCLPTGHAMQADALVDAGLLLKRPTPQFLQPTLSCIRVASLQRPEGHCLQGTLAPDGNASISEYRPAVQSLHMVTFFNDFESPNVPLGHAEHSRRVLVAVILTP